MFIISYLTTNYHVFRIINDQFNPSVDYDWRSDLDISKFYFSKLKHA
jgi:hypothetical protein